jgi:hypothetical protein
MLRHRLNRAHRPEDAEDAAADDLIPISSQNGSNLILSDMQPSEALSASAQVAVTLAGFAGVVVAFRSRSVHEWSKIDKFRLGILLTNSAIPFVLSIVGMLLSSTSLDLATVWRLCSIFAFVTIVSMASGYRASYRRFSSAEFKTSGGRIVIFYTSSIIGIGVTLLQLYNVITLHTFWPFFAAIATLLVLAMLQFTFLVTARDDAQS